MKPYLYVAWLKAQNDLIEALMRVKKDEIPDVVSGWFKEHLTEFGASYTISPFVFEKMRSDLKEIYAEEDKRALYRIGEEILKAGAYTIEVTPNMFEGERTEIRVLALAVDKSRR